MDFEETSETGDCKHSITFPWVSPSWDHWNYICIWVSELVDDFVSTRWGHPPISTGYSSKPCSGNNQSRRGRGKVLSNLISSRATSSDFLPDQQETTGGDEVEALLDSGSLAGDFIAKRVVSQLKLEHHLVSNQVWVRTLLSNLLLPRVIRQ